jgi:hypothetical protein
VTCALSLAAAVRDILLPGTPLPFPDDDKLQLLVGSKIVNKQRVPSPVAPELVLLICLWGMANGSYSVIKLVTVFTAWEGTFRRRNLFIVFGVTELTVAALLLKQNAFVYSYTGISILPFTALYGFSAFVFLSDALLRARKEKKK